MDMRSCGHLGGSAAFLDQVSQCCGIMSCQALSHMSPTDEASIRKRLGEEWMEHYGVLYAANAGCLHCVRKYHDKGGSRVKGRMVGLWYGSHSDPFYNCWRATFECQRAEVFEAQESVRVYLQTLPEAAMRIQQTQMKWKENKFLETRAELLDAFNTAPAALEAKSEVVEPTKSRKRPLVENIETAANDASYSRNVAKFHALCFQGDLKEALVFVTASQDIIWAVSAHTTGQLFRASDWSRLGRLSFQASLALYNELIRLEEQCLFLADQESKLMH